MKDGARFTFSHSLIIRILFWHAGECSAHPLWLTCYKDLTLNDLTEPSPLDSAEIGGHQLSCWSCSTVHESIKIPWDWEEASKSTWLPSTESSDSRIVMSGYEFML